MGNERNPAVHIVHSACASTAIRYLEQFTDGNLNLIALELRAGLPRTLLNRSIYRVVI
jgi:hypothetical protein